MVAYLHGKRSEGLVSGTGVVHVDGERSGGARTVPRGKRCCGEPRALAGGEGRPTQGGGERDGEESSDGGEGQGGDLVRAESGPTATVWVHAGTSFLVPLGAPSPDAFRPSLDEAELTRRLESKRREREHGIAQAFELLRQRGAPLDRTLAMITYDCELAPVTTNRAQLEAIGVHVPPVDHALRDERTATDALWSIVYGLARLGIYLSSTDHLDDRELVERLLTRILDDEVRDIAPNGDMAEFIDFCDPSKALAAANPSSDLPDGLTGPFESGADLEEEEESPFARPTPKRRDHLLPRPLRDGWQDPLNRTS